MNQEDNNPYRHFTKEELILRDYLAVDRTLLANERTFLANIRTALTFFVSGVTFIKFFGHIMMAIVGWAFIPIGIFIFIAGLLKYQTMHQVIFRLHQAPKEDNSQSDNVFPPEGI